MIRCQRLLLEIVRLAERLEVKFAFPTQTVEVARLPRLFRQLVRSKVSGLRSLLGRCDLSASQSRLAFGHARAVQPRCD